MNTNTQDPHVYDNYKYADFFINKETEYYYSGSSLNFSLSHALFSSFEIDSGSRLLLKTLTPLLKENSPSSILDAGCGTGILGTALKKCSPGSDLYFYDRDSLAVHFTELNLKKNGVHEYNSAYSLLMFPFEDKKFDLIVSNLPAKAGKEVLSDFMIQAPLHLNKNGTAAVVIVKPLSAFAEETISNNGLEIIYSEKTANYTVLHFRSAENIMTEGTNADTGTAGTMEAEDTSNNDSDTEDTSSGESGKIKSAETLFESYIREEKYPFDIKGNIYNLDTATGLPDFDNLSFNTKLSSELVLSIKDTVSSDKKQLVVNPGQGLIPVILNGICSDEEDEDIELFISSNDILQLKMTERNLKKISPSEKRVYLNSPTFFHTADSLENGTFDSIFYLYNFVSGFKKHDLIMKRLNKLLKPGGKLILTSTATEISRFLGNCKGFANVKGKKNKGIRSVYLKKTAESA